MAFIAPITMSYQQKLEEDRKKAAALNASTATAAPSALVGAQVGTTAPSADAQPSTKQTYPAGSILGQMQNDDAFSKQIADTWSKSGAPESIKKSVDISLKGREPSLSSFQPAVTEIAAPPMPPAVKSSIYKWDDGTTRPIPQTFENKVAIYNKAVEAGGPSAEWGDKPASTWDSLYGEESPFKSGAAKDILSNIVSGVKGEDPALKALAKQQGLSQMMLNRRANAARAGAAANLAQSGLMGQAAGQNAMAGVERSITSEAAKQSLEQGAQTADTQSRLLQQWTDRGLSQMNEEQQAKQAKDSNLMRLYADLAKDSPSAKKAAIRSLESDLGIQTATNADAMDEYQRQLALLDPTRMLEQQGLVKASRELEAATPTTPGSAAQELGRAVQSSLSTEGKPLSPVQIEELKAQSLPEAGSFTSERTAEILGAPVLEGAAADKIDLKAGNQFTIGGVAYAVKDLGLAKAHSGMNFQEVTLKNLEDGTTKRVWVSRGAQPGYAEKMAEFERAQQNMIRKGGR